MTTHTKRYKNDPEYRKHVINLSRRSLARLSENPIYKQIVALRKRIWNVKDSIERLKEKTERRDDLLWELKIKKKALERALNGRNKKSDRQTNSLHGSSI